MDSKRNSLPSLTMNKFFVSKRASMFEVCEESPREKRDRSPCGALETSERKLKARKDREKKAAMSSRKKRQSDPYAEESTEVEEVDNLDIETKKCGHSNRSVNLGLVKRYLKQSVSVGECVHCTKAKPFSDVDNSSSPYKPVIWLCAFCGYQGCDRNSGGKHAFSHYKTPRSDPHCIVINTQFWTVWCYECDSEIIDTSSKKLHEVVQYIKRLSELAPKRVPMSHLTIAKPSTNLTTQFSGSDSRLYTRKTYEEISKSSKNQKQYQSNMSLSHSVPKVKGISNLGNTCFFNSVIQNLAQTHYFTQILDTQIHSGQRVSLPGWCPEDYKKHIEKKLSGSNSEDEDSDMVELKPMDVFLPDGGPISVAFNVFLKEMHNSKKNGVINPGHLFSQICKKSVQFQGYEQQDAHELLRCLLDAVRTEEILRGKKGILKAFALNEKTDPDSVNSRLRKMIKGYGKQATHTIVEQIFGGQLISTVFCEECHFSSQVFESFLDLSLPVNEEKGKPKNCSFNEDDNVFDYFGNKSGISSHNSTNYSKYSTKKHRKEEKRRNRRNKGHRSRGSSNPTCPVILKEEKEEEEEEERAELKARRLTEKRRPEDEEEFRIKEEMEKRNREEWESRKKNGKKKGESPKFKMLMEARNAMKKEERGSELEEESDEEQEYDLDDDEEEDCFYTLRRSKKLDGAKEDEGVEGEEEEVEEEEEEEEEVEEEEEEEEEEETEETETNETESDVSSNVNSKNKKISRETSDADVEDNTDSEYVQNNLGHGTRHPSIVVDESNADDPPDSHDTPEVDNRYLKTSNSCDQLNYSSDCSERYFTAAGPDTMDELDDDNKSNWKNIFSGTLEETCLKVGEMRIRRNKSSSRESLLDSRKGHRHGSSENLFTYNSNEKLNEDWSQHQKKSILKKLKQDWISRSMSTLAQRYQSSRQECSIMSCMANFTSPELMIGNNKITCENCNKLMIQSGEDSKNFIKSNASKQLLIVSPPAVLTLHLKRFHHVGYNLAKVNRHVQFPLVLDIASFTSSISLGLNNMSKGQTQVLYGLYGIVEHSGRLNSGHYVAYVRSRPLDTNRSCKQMLNLKPWNQFDVNHLMTEFANKSETEKCHLNGGFRFQQQPFQPIDMESVEEEIKNGKWFFVSDTYVSQVNIDKVLKAQAYLLFYERIL